MKRRALVLKVPKEAVNSKKRRKPPTDDHCDYLKRHQRPVNRRRTDPVVVMSTMLESILNEMRDLPDVQPFLFPVNAKVNIILTYYRCIDFNYFRINLREHFRINLDKRTFFASYIKYIKKKLMFVI